MPVSGFPCVSAARMRLLDRLARTRYGIPAVLLMENAGRAVADEVRETLKGRRGRVAVLCGGGHNGGDGFVAARHLAARGLPVTVFYFRKPNDADSGLHFAILRKIRTRLVDCTRSTVRLRATRGWACVVDALLGTGVSRPLTGGLLEAVRWMNRAGAPVVSVDLPSGMDADTGRAWGDCVRAVKTVTMGLPKKGLYSPGAAGLAGRVVVENLSMPERLRKARRR